uniref:Uncharacterized protein n=1 Tax=Rhizophora mucronata TaxID=61149 RepID=A0A2P2Q933_RHIMU
MSLLINGVINCYCLAWDHHANQIESLIICLPWDIIVCSCEQCRSTHFLILILKIPFVAAGDMKVKGSEE